MTIPTVYSPITRPLSDATTAQLLSISSDGSVYTFGSETPDLALVNAGDIILHRRPGRVWSAMIHCPTGSGLVRVELPACVPTRTLHDAGNGIVGAGRCARWHGIMAVTHLVWQSAKPNQTRPVCAGAWAGLVGDDPLPDGFRAGPG